MIIFMVLFFILFLLWTYNMRKGNLDKIDKKVYSLIKINDSLTSFFKLITDLASTKFLILVSFLLLIFIRDKYLVFTFISCLIINSCLIGLAKNLLRRTRPNINRLVNEKGYSYPSGHTMSATSLYGITILLVIVSNTVLPIKILLISLFVILILLIGFSRIYLGVHYFSDVIGGLLLASSYIFLYSYLIHFILNII